MIKNDAKLGQLKESYEFFVKYVNRKPYQIEFVRCESNACNHCQNMSTRSNELLDTIRMFGNEFPIPQRSVNKDHFPSLTEMLRVAGIKPMKALPVTTANFGSCRHGCNYTMYSKADIVRHERLLYKF